jgi:hypothetical protein
MTTCSSTVNVLIRPMNRAPSAWSGPDLGGGDRPGHALPIVVPELGDAVDLPVQRGNVGAWALLHDVRLYVAPQTRHGMGKRRVNVDPVPDELLVRQVGPTNQQRDALDHGRGVLREGCAVVT